MRSMLKGPFALLSARPWSGVATGLEDVHGHLSAGILSTSHGASTLGGTSYTSNLRRDAALEDAVAATVLVVW